MPKFEARPARFTGAYTLHYNDSVIGYITISPDKVVSFREKVGATAYSAELLTNIVATMQQVTKELEDGKAD